MGRGLDKEKGLPTKFWSAALLHSNYLVNVVSDEDVHCPEPWPYSCSR